MLPLSTAIPGDIVLDKYILLKYVPLDDEGFNLEIVRINSFTLS
jgi:hypothetical protein